MSHTRLPFPGETVLADTDDARWFWHHSEGLPPAEIPATSHGFVWLICDRFHVYKRKAHIQNGSVNRCPVCSNLALVRGVNDFATTHPIEARFFVAPGRTGRTPETTSALSRATASWRCDHGHTFTTSFTKMGTEKRHHCQCHKHKRLNRGFSDLASRNPVLAAQWDSERNHMPPENVDAGSHTTYWWICPAGHRFQTSPKQRMLASPTGNGCLQCHYDAPIDLHARKPVVPADLRPTPQQIRDYFLPRPDRHAPRPDTSSRVPNPLKGRPRKRYSQTTKQHAVERFRALRDDHNSHGSTLRAVQAELAPHTPRIETINDWVKAAGIDRTLRPRNSGTRSADVAGQWM